MFNCLSNADPTWIVCNYFHQLTRLAAMRKKRDRNNNAKAHGFVLQINCKKRRAHRRRCDRLALYRWFMKGQIDSAPQHCQAIQSIIPALHDEFRTASVLRTLEDDWFRSSAATIICEDFTEVTAEGQAHSPESEHDESNEKVFRLECSSNENPSSIQFSAPHEDHDYSIDLIKIVNSDSLSHKLSV